MKVFSFYNNSSHYVKWQSLSFKKFLDCSFVVIDFSKNKNISNSLQIETSKYGDEYININDLPDLKRTKCCERNCPAVDKAFSWIVKNESSNFMILHSDIFAIKKFSLTEALGNSDVIIRKQRRNFTNYAWEGLFGAKGNSLREEDLDWRCGIYNNSMTDAGGGTYNWINNNKNRISTFEYNGEIYTGGPNVTWHGGKHNNSHIVPPEFLLEYKDEYTAEIIEGSFLHFKRGSGWAGENYFKDKMRWFESVMEGVLEDKIIFKDIKYDASYLNPDHETWV